MQVVILLAVESSLHVVTGELHAVHRIVDTFKFGIAISYPMATASIQACLNGPRDFLFYSYMIVLLLGGAATVGETIQVFGVFGSIVVFGFNFLFIALLKIALKDANNLGKIKKV